MTEQSDLKDEFRKFQSDMAALSAQRLWATLLKRGSPVPQDFCDWFIAGLAATCGLMIGNYERLSANLGTKGYIWTLGIFVLSISLGVVAKLLGSLAAARAQFELLEATSAAEFRKEITEHATKAVGTPLGKYFEAGDFNFFDEKFREYYERPMFRLTKWRFRRLQRKAARSNDPMLSMVLPVRQLFVQMAATQLMIFTALAGLILAAVFVAVSALSVPSVQLPMPRPGATVPATRVAGSRPASPATSSAQPTPPFRR